MWHDEESFWSNFEPTIFSNNMLTLSSGEVDQIINLLQMKQSYIILDVPCGIGRHALEFAKRGYKVTGVDLMERYIQRAKKEAEKEHLVVEYTQSDMRSFCRENFYDVALHLYNSFGYFDDVESSKKVFENIFISLKKGGQLVIQTESKETLAHVLSNCGKREWIREKDVFCLSERKITNDWSALEIEWHCIIKGKMDTYLMKLKLYSYSEIKKILLECGFSKVQCYGSLTGEVYGEGAKELIIVAQKGTVSE